MVLVSLALAGSADLLKLRDDPGCAALGEATPALRAELFGLTTAVSPPWVPVRATTCLVVLYGEAPGFAELVAPLFTDPERVALAWTVVSHLDGVAEGEALARLAVGVTEERWRRRIDAKIAADPRPEVRAVLDGARARE